MYWIGHFSNTPHIIFFLLNFFTLDIFVCVYRLTIILLILISLLHIFLFSQIVRCVEHLMFSFRQESANSLGSWSILDTAFKNTVSDNSIKDSNFLVDFCSRFFNILQPQFLFISAEIVEYSTFLMVKL